jgi:hypothetical protein
VRGRSESAAEGEALTGPSQYRRPIAGILSPRHFRCSDNLRTCRVSFGLYRGQRASSRAVQGYDFQPRSRTGSLRPGRPAEGDRRDASSRARISESSAQANAGYGSDNNQVLASDPLRPNHKMLTARAASSATVTSEMLACTIIITLAQRDSTGTSVGENAVLVLNARNR